MPEHVNGLWIRCARSVQSCARCGREEGGTYFPGTGMEVSGCAGAIAQADEELGPLAGTGQMVPSGNNSVARWPRLRPRGRGPVHEPAHRESRVQWESVSGQGPTWWVPRNGKRATFWHVSVMRVIYEGF